LPEHIVQYLCKHLYSRYISKLTDASLVSSDQLYMELASESNVEICLPILSANYIAVDMRRIRLLAIECVGYCVLFELEVIELTSLLFLVTVITFLLG